MSKNVFYADLDLINNKGVFVTGHGKGIVSKNNFVKGNYIFNDMIRLFVENGKLFGYQGYIETTENELTNIEYLLYLYDKDEAGQPELLSEITVDEYLCLSQHNIERGAQILTRSSVETFSEYSDILKAAINVHFIAIPFTDEENRRAELINEAVK